MGKSTRALAPAICGVFVACGTLHAQTAIAGTTHILHEVIVTAQRRHQRLQHIPMSVSAFTPEMLNQANVSGITDLKTLVPALNADGSFGTVLPFIRGVGNPAVIVGNEASVPIYVDGVYISRLNSSFFEFNDIKRVEVLDGPQGTLFGRNSTGGLIQIITRNPTDTPAIDGSLGYGSYQTMNAKLYASDGKGPIAGNVALYYRDQGEGWGRNITTGQGTYKQHNLGIRSKWRYNPTENVMFTLEGDYTAATSSIGMVQNEYRGSVQGNPAVPGAIYAPLGFYDSRVEHPVESIVHAGGLSLTYHQRLTFGNLRSISAYRETTGKIAIDADFSPLPLYEADEPYIVLQLSQEMQLYSLASSKINWMVGAFYLHLNSAYVPTILTGTDFVPKGIAVNLFGRQITNSYAVYGQTTFPVATRTKLTLGARYSLDKIAGSGTTDVSKIDGSILVPGAPLGARTSFGKATWRIALAHRFSSTVLAYTSASSGYKAGLYNLQPFDGTPVRPEILYAGEIGLKTESFGRRLRLDGALFYNYIQDPQVERDIGSGVSLINANSAVTKGLDINGAAEPLNNLILRFGFTWMSALYKSFANAPFYYPNPLSPYGNLPNVISGSANGARMPRAPDFVFSIALNYRIPVRSGELNVGTNYWHTSTIYWTPDNLYPQRGYGLLGAQLSYRPRGDRWDIRLAGRNLTGVKYYTTMDELSGPSGTVGAPGAPRTVEFTVGFNY